MRQGIGSLFGRIAEITTKYITSSATVTAATLTETERHVRVTTAVSDLTLTLPAAHEVPEAVYTFELMVDGAKDMIVKSPEPSPPVTLTFADAGDYLVVYSNGLRWFVVLNNGGS